MKRAVIFVEYENDKDLQDLLQTAKNSKAKISAVYENLDAADMEHLEGIIHRDCIQEE